MTALPSSRQFAAARLTSSRDVNGNRAIAHVAYELQRRLLDNPTESNESLLAQVGWVLVLLGEGDLLLGSDRQRGLIGECLFLRRLIISARRVGLEPIVALRRWFGSYPSKRDFAALDIAVEVKTTSLAARLHHISSLDQLEPTSPTEHVYVYSVGLRSEITAARKLTHFVADVKAQLVTPQGDPDPVAIAHFEEQLQRYGYILSHENFYNSGPGYLSPHLAPALFEESTLRRLRLSDFSNGMLPEEVASVGYTLNILSDPLPQKVADDVCVSLLQASAITYE